MKLCFIDLETTGLFPSKHGVIQIAASIADTEWSSNVQPFPRQELDPYALKVNGVTKEELKTFPLPAEVYIDFEAYLSQFADKYDKRDKLFFTAYNAHFDNSFLRAWFLNLGDHFFGSWFWSNPIDVMTLAGQALADQRADMKDFKLGTVAKTLGIEVREEGLHEAMYDVTLMIEVYRKSMAMIFTTSLLTTK